MGNERYIRVDFKMPTQQWRLDEIEALPQLLHYGNQAAVDHYPRLKRAILSTKKTPLSPVP